MDQQLALQLVWHIEEWADKYHDADPASHSQITRDAHDLLLRLREVLRREHSSDQPKQWANRHHQRCQDVTGGDDLLTAPLSVLGLIVRASNALLNNGISTVGDLLAKTEVEIATLPGIGPFALADIGPN